MEDKKVYKEILDIQNTTADLYNSYLKLSHTSEVRDEFLKILSMEHKICEDIFKDGEKRGYFTVELADTDDITRIRESLN